MATIKVCDICGDNHCSTISLCVDDSMSPAGDRDYFLQSFDLCSKCLSSVVNTYFKKKSYEETNEFLHLVKFKIKKNN